jgi:hypothetical protein
MAVRVRPLTNVNGVVGHAGVLAMVPTRLTQPNTSRGNWSFVPGQICKSELMELGVGSAGTIDPATNYGIVSVSPAPRHKKEWPQLLLGWGRFVALIAGPVTARSNARDRNKLNCSKYSE